MVLVAASNEEQFVYNIDGEFVLRHYGSKDRMDLKTLLGKLDAHPSYFANILLDKECSWDHHNPHGLQKTMLDPA